MQANSMDQFVRICGRRRREFWAGVIGIAPLVLGAIPFGLIYGVLAVTIGLPTTMAQAMSTIVFAGSAQFTTAQLLRDGAPLLVIILTVAVLNVRHVLYSASLAPYLRHLNRGWKVFLAYLLTDEAYAIAITRYWEDKANPCDRDTLRSTDRRHWFVLGASLTLWVNWQISTLIGVYLGAQIPAAWSLDFAMPLTFIAIVVPALRDRATVGAAVVAGTVVLLALALPLKLGLVTAMIAGILAGTMIEQWQGKKRGGE
ncbi:MAG TPA: AzlC family ABC transporter permease [Caldilineaceae bacterium]|nr:AzlC family ABC transporter permease [Caldilineaceae bacterium]